MRVGQIVRLACPPDTEHSRHAGAVGLVVGLDSKSYIVAVLVNGFIIRVHDGWLDFPEERFSS